MAEFVEDLFWGLLNGLGLLCLSALIMVAIIFPILYWFNRRGLAGRGLRIERRIAMWDWLTLSECKFYWRRRKGHTRERPMTDLKAVTIYTTDHGPIIEDLFLGLDFGDQIWLLASEHPAYQNFFDRLGRDLELDYMAYLEAMSSIDNKSFHIWPKA